MSRLADNDAAPAPSRSQWRAMLGIPASELICQICDVTWNDDSGDSCWMCGDRGQRIAEAMPWSATAPALFL